MQNIIALLGFQKLAMGIRQSVYGCPKSIFAECLLLPTESLKIKYLYFLQNREAYTSEIQHPILVLYEGF